MAGPVHRKRRITPARNKNDLRVSKAEREAIEKTRAGNLRQRYPNVRELHLEWRMETTAQAVLEDVRRDVALDESLLLDIECQGGCGNGLFLLADSVELLLQNGQEKRDGMVLCQAVSYNDPKLTCGTKLYYSIQARYA